MKVVVTGKLPEDILGSIEAEHSVDANPHDKPMRREDLLAALPDAEGLLCMITDRIDGEALDAAPKLRMIANCAVGFDNIDVSACSQRGVLVSNTPGVLTDATADLTFALILAAARRVVEGDARTRAGEFKFWAPFLFLGREVSGKTLGIIGLGRIGHAVARRARGFDMRVIYHNRRRLESAEEKDLGVEWVEFGRLLRESDFVSLHVPLTDETRGLIGRDELAAMKPDAFLINAARGPVVDEGALVDALRDGGIAGAGLDVYEHEPALDEGLTDLKNTVLLPHVGSATIETRRRMASLAVDNLLAGLSGRKPPNCLNP